MRIAHIVLFVLMALMTALALPQVEAQKRPTNLSVTPVIQSIQIINGQLFASGMWYDSCLDRSHATHMTYLLTQ